MQYKVIWSKGVNVRTGPSTYAANIFVNGIQKVLAIGVVVDVVEDHIADTSDPTNLNKQWVRLADGGYAASDYPNDSLAPAQRMQLVATQPPATDVTVVGATVHLSDGSNVEMLPQ